MAFSEVWKFVLESLLALELIPHFLLVFYQVLAITLAMIAGAGWGMYYTERKKRLSRKFTHPLNDKKYHTAVVSDPNENQGDLDDTA